MNIIRTDINKEFIINGQNLFREIYKLWIKEQDPEHAFILLDHWFKGYVKNPKIAELVSFNEFINVLINNEGLIVLPEKIQDRENYIKLHSIDLSKYNEFKISYTNYHILEKDNNEISLASLINNIFNLLINKYDDLKELHLKD